jgi:hypothetical protein
LPTVSRSPCSDRIAAAGLSRAPPCCEYRIKDREIDAGIAAAPCDITSDAGGRSAPGTVTVAADTDSAGAFEQGSIATNANGVAASGAAAAACSLVPETMTASAHARPA